MIAQAPTACLVCQPKKSGIVESLTGPAKVLRIGSTGTFGFVPDCAGRFLRRARRGSSAVPVLLSGSDAEASPPRLRRNSRFRPVRVRAAVGLPIARVAPRRGCPAASGRRPGPCCWVPEYCGLRRRVCPTFRVGSFSVIQGQSGTRISPRYLLTPPLRRVWGRAA